MSFSTPEGSTQNMAVAQHHTDSKRVGSSCYAASHPDPGVSDLAERTNPSCGCVAPVTIASSCCHRASKTAGIYQPLSLILMGCQGGHHWTCLKRRRGVHGLVEEVLPGRCVPTSHASRPWHTWGDMVTTLLYNTGSGKDPPSLAYSTAIGLSRYSQGGQEAGA